MSNLISHSFFLGGAAAATRVWGDGVKFWSCLVACARLDEQKTDARGAEPSFHQTWLPKGAVIEQVRFVEGLFGLQAAV